MPNCCQAQALQGRDLVMEPGNGALATFGNVIEVGKLLINGAEGARILAANTVVGGGGDASFQVLFALTQLATITLLRLRLNVLPALAEATDLLDQLVGGTARARMFFEARRGLLIGFQGLANQLG